MSVVMDLILNIISFGDECNYAALATATSSFFFQFSSIDANIPANNPQNAAPIPNKEIPDADTKMVMTAGSRCVSSSSATFRLLPMVLKIASPAMARVNSLGKAKNNATMVAPNEPMNSQHKPAIKVDL